MPTPDRRPLVDLPRALLATTGTSIPYSTAWRHAVAGTIPAERIGSKWFYVPSDVPRIARALGLHVPSPA